MKKKKSGFTLLEMIIVLVLSVMVISIVHLIFLTGMKVFNDTNVKSDIQIEGQQVQQEISNKLMGAKHIKKIETNNYGTINFDNDGNSENLSSIKDNWVSVKSITLDTAGKSSEDSIEVKTYTFKVDGKNLICAEDGSSSGKILTTNLYEKGSDTEEKSKFSVKVTDNYSVQFNINLRKEKGITDAEYPINVDVLFRNNDIE